MGVAGLNPARITNNRKESRKSLFLSVISFFGVIMSRQRDRIMQKSCAVASTCFASLLNLIACVGKLYPKPINKKDRVCGLFLFTEERICISRCLSSSGTHLQASPPLTIAFDSQTDAGIALVHACCTEQLYSPLDP